LNIPKFKSLTCNFTQDRCPPYPTEEAINLLEKELGRNFDEIFDLPVENRKPVAAASIGQVYKAVLKSNSALVAIKIQRPNCEDAIAIDLYIMRWYASLIQNILKSISRDIDLVGVIDDFGDLIYREIDYRAEAVNAQRFAELYSDIPDVFVPKVYTDLSTSKVLTMEWVDGARLNDKKAIESMGLDSSKFVDTLVQCTLRQMLENGFFHADPHAGITFSISISISISISFTVTVLFLNVNVYIHIYIYI
jgi:aarF domain-containing kinase